MVFHYFSSLYAAKFFLIPAKKLPKACDCPSSADLSDAGVTTAAPSLQRFYVPEGKEKGGGSHTDPRTTRRPPNHHEERSNPDVTKP